MLMGKWTEKEDGFYYNEEGNQRFRRRENGSIQVQSVPVGETMTQQQFKEDCDVNVILKRILKTGEMPSFQSRTGYYGDFTEMPDYQGAMDTVIKAQNLFLELPHEVRTKFQNNPQELIDFLKNPDNDQEAVKLGLKVLQAEPPVDPVLQELKQVNQNLSAQKTKTKKEAEA